jgi:hypothetical protein
MQAGSKEYLTFGIFMANASRKYRIYSPLEHLWPLQAESTKYTHLWNIYGPCKQKVQNKLTFGIKYLWPMQAESTKYTHLWNIYGQCKQEV